MTLRTGGSRFPSAASTYSLPVKIFLAALEVQMLVCLSVCVCVTLATTVLDFCRTSEGLLRTSEGLLKDF